VAELKPGTFNVYHLDPEHDPEAEWRNLTKMKQPLKAGTPLKNRITATNMPKAKKRDTTGREARINAAIRALKEGRQESMGAAAEPFDILKSTLYYRYMGERTSRHLAQVDNQLISDLEEKAIVAWCKEQDNRGFPPRLDMVKSMALFLYEKRTGDKRKSLGKNWITRFLNRHPDMATKFNTKLDRQRAHASCPWLLRDYFSKLVRIIHQHNLKVFQIFNMDEKGFLIGIAARGKVLCHRRQRNPRVTHEGTREMVTVVEMIYDFCCRLCPPAHDSN